MKIILFVLTFFLLSNLAYSQSETDTLKVCYLVWDLYQKTDKPVLLQKEGYVIKFHSDVPKYLRKPDEREDISFLNSKLRPEEGLVVKYSIYY